MTRIAHLSDLHVSSSGGRIEDHRETLNAIVDDVIAASPDLVCLTGDFFGVTVPWQSKPIERDVLCPALVRLANVAPVMCLIGNHDSALDILGFEHLGGAWPIRVLTRPDVVEVTTAAGTAWCYPIPYPSRRWLLAGETAPRGLAESQTLVEEKLASLIRLWGVRIRARREMHPNEPHLLLAHAMISGARVAGGEVLAGQEITIRRYDLDGLPIDYGALGHIHLRQEVAERCWYAGSTWRNDFGETDPKSWHLVEIDRDPNVGCYRVPRERERYGDTSHSYNPNDERLRCDVVPVPIRCRDFRSLEYRWASHADEDLARWLKRPTDDEIAACAGAEVRMRLTAPETWVSSIPWAEEVARVTAAGAHRIQEDRRIEPSLRTRSPEVATATEPMGKIRAFWGTLATPPTPGEQAAAELVLHELQELDDDGVRLATEEALASA